MASLFADVAAAAALARRTFGRNVPALLFPALVSALGPLALFRGVLNPLPVAFAIALALWVACTNAVFVEFARYVPAPAAPDDEPLAEHAVLPEEVPGEMPQTASTIARIAGVAGEAVVLGWPILAVAVVGASAQWIASAFAMRVIPFGLRYDPSAFVVVVAGTKLALNAAALAAGWAFAFVVTEGLDATSAFVRVRRALGNPVVALRLGLCAAGCFVLYSLLTTLAATVDDGRFPSNPLFALGAPLFTAYTAVGTVVQVAACMVFWAFAYALAFVTRPPGGREPPAVRRGARFAPPWMRWAVRLFAEPPVRSD